MEVVKDIAAIVGVVLSIISLITLCSKGGRSFVKNIFLKNTADIREQDKQQNSDIALIKNDVSALLTKTEIIEEVSKQQCRDTIKAIYYKYQKDKVIPLYERKTADSVHKIYSEKFEGNSYENLLYNEIIKWELDTVTYEDYLNEKFGDE